MNDDLQRAVLFVAMILISPAAMMTGIGLGILIMRWLGVVFHGN